MICTSSIRYGSPVLCVSVHGHSPPALRSSGILFPKRLRLFHIQRNLMVCATSLYFPF